MPVNIVVPELGESVVEATISQWRKKAGDAVAAGEAVVDLETEKVNLEVAAERAGVLARIDKQAGQDVRVGEVIGAIEAQPAEAAKPADGQQPAAAEAAKPADGQQPTTEAPKPAPVAAQKQPAASAPKPDAAPAPTATPRSP